MAMEDFLNILLKWMDQVTRTPTRNSAFNCEISLIKVLTDIPRLQMFERASQYARAGPSAQLRDHLANA